MWASFEIMKKIWNFEHFLKRKNKDEKPQKIKEKERKKIKEIENRNKKKENKKNRKPCKRKKHEKNRSREPSRRFLKRLPGPASTPEMGRPVRTARSCASAEAQQMDARERQIGFALYGARERRAFEPSLKRTANGPAQLELAKSGLVKKTHQ